jgi:hypothetical protein
MKDLQTISHGVLAGMLTEIAKRNPRYSEAIVEAARRLRLMPSHKAATKVKTEVLQNGAPDEIIAELITEIAHLKRLLQGC